jgi:hypothetical protein
MSFQGTKLAGETRTPKAQEWVNWKFLKGFIGGNFIGKLLEGIYRRNVD